MSLKQDLNIHEALKLSTNLHINNILEGVLAVLMHYWPV